MATYQRRESRRDDSGARVILFQDANDGSWSVGRDGDPTLDPIPLAGFASAAAARRWADAQFRGGEWQPEHGRVHV